MNPKLGMIFERRSVRRFTGRPVPDTMLHDLFEAAMAAPSAVAKDPWHFIVVREPAMLEKIAAILPKGAFVTKAGLCVIVCGDIEKAHGNELSYMIQDCSAAIENLLLAASALGLGACWLGVHPRPDRIEGLSGMFALPANIIPVSAIAIGWPAERPPARTRHRTEAIHVEKW